MTYPENLSLVELAEHYAKYQNDKCLEELAVRDKINSMTYDERMALRFNEEPDNQLVFDFHKEVASAVESTENTSVKDDNQWKEAYEAGFRAGGKHGLKIAEIMQIPGVSAVEIQRG